MDVIRKLLLQNSPTSSTVLWRKKSLLSLTILANWRVPVGKNSYQQSSNHRPNTVISRRCNHLHTAWLLARQQNLFLRLRAKSVKLRTWWSMDRRSRELRARGDSKRMLHLWLQISKELSLTKLWWVKIRTRIRETNLLTPSQIMDRQVRQFKIPKLRIRIKSWQGRVHSLS